MLRPPPPLAPPRPTVAGAVLAVAVLLGAVLTGCSSSGGSAADRTGDQKAACRQVSALVTGLNAISDDLAASQRLFRRLSTQADALATTAPSSLRSDAADLRAAIATTKKYVDRATTIEQLQAFEQRPAVQDAFSRLLTAGGHVGDWRKQHC